jgi:hypothetical protein
VSGVVRVMVHEAWDEVTLPWDDSTPLASLKHAALEVARVTETPQAFALKFNGAELQDESATLAASGVPANGALILLRRRRRAVR